MPPPVADSSVATPSLLLDLDTLEANLRVTQRKADANGVTLRPHIKTHKSSRIARMQLEAGARGLTCATPAEAVGLGRAGVRTSVFIAAAFYPTPHVINALREACDLHEEVIFAVENETSLTVLNNADLPASFRVSLEVDPGYGRTGRAPDELASLAARSSIPIHGAFTHGGHGYGPGNAEAAGRDELVALEAAAAQLASVGIPDPVLSAGSTPTLPHIQSSPATEVRPGTYALGDHQQMAAGVIHQGQVACTVAATVMASGDGRFVLNAGAKALTKDRASWVESHGVIAEWRTATIISLSDHHAVATIEGRGPEVGEQVHVIPNHICPVVNLFDVYLVIHPVTGEVRDRIPIDLRGHLS